VRLDGGVVGFGQRAVVKEDDVWGAAEVTAERFGCEEIHHQLSMAGHGDEGEGVIVGDNGRRIEESTTVEIEPCPSHGTPCTKEHTKFLSSSAWL
jgi:hypothetical protein